MAYRCDQHPESMAVLLITNLDNGDVVALCPLCVGPWAVALGEAFGAYDAGLLAQANTDPATGDDTDDDAAADDQPAAVPEPGPEPKVGGDPADPQPNPAAGDGDDQADDDPEARGFSAQTVSLALAGNPAAVAELDAADVTEPAPASR